VKKKDLMYLLLAVVIMLVAGYVGYTQLMPKKPNSTVVEVEKIGKIPSQLDAAGIARISDPEKVVNFDLPVDLSGLNNRTPFGP
jgi:hypothetical protein